MPRTWSRRFSGESICSQRRCAAGARRLDRPSAASRRTRRCRSRPPRRTVTCVEPRSGRISEQRRRDARVRLLRRGRGFVGGAAGELRAGRVPGGDDDRRSRRRSPPSAIRTTFVSIRRLRRCGRAADRRAATRRRLPPHEARVVLVDVELAVEAEVLGVRAQEALDVGLRRQQLELLVLERAQVLAADLRGELRLGRSRSRGASAPRGGCCRSRTRNPKGYRAICASGESRSRRARSRRSARNTPLSRPKSAPKRVRPTTLAADAPCDREARPPAQVGADQPEDRRGRHRAVQRLQEADRGGALRDLHPDRDRGDGREAEEQRSSGGNSGAHGCTALTTGWAPRASADGTEPFGGEPLGEPLRDRSRLDGNGGRDERVETDDPDGAGAPAVVQILTAVVDALERGPDDRRRDRAANLEVGERLADDVLLGRGRERTERARSARRDDRDRTLVDGGERRLLARGRILGRRRAGRLGSCEGDGTPRLNAPEQASTPPGRRARPWGAACLRPSPRARRPDPRDRRPGRGAAAPRRRCGAARRSPNRRSPRNASRMSTRDEAQRRIGDRTRRHENQRVGGNLLERARSATAPGGAETKGPRRLRCAALPARPCSSPAVATVEARAGGMAAAAGSGEGEQSQQCQAAKPVPEQNARPQSVVGMSRIRPARRSAACLATALRIEAGTRGLHAP